MRLTEWTAAHKRTWDMRHEWRVLCKQLLQETNADKARLNKNMKELLAAAELGAQLYLDYKAAGEQLHLALEEIDVLLEQQHGMSAAELKNHLRELVVFLNGVCNAWSISKEDKEYKMTVQSFQTMAEQCAAYREGMRAIMLRSELENTKAVLKDAAAWNMPDFLAAAYYEQHADKSMLCELEREQRNQLVQRYLKEELLEELAKQVRLAGRETEFHSRINEYIYGKAVEACEDLNDITA